MLHFKARRKSPTLASDLTPSQRRMMRYFEEAAQATRREIAGNLSSLADRIAHETATKIANSLPMGPWSDAQQEIQDELHGEVLDGGSRVSLPIRKATFSFDRERPEAAAWAAREAGGLIVQITEEQRLLVRDLVSSAGLGERTPLQVARALRDSIGLTAEQAQWVENRWGREYAARISSGASLTDAERGADKAADLYYQRTLRYRSETIARTEILKAAHEGRREAWNQGVQEGWINPGAQKQWDTVDDPCPECAAMDGVTVGISEEFAVGDPPLHPNCRCDVLLVDEIPQDIQDMTDEELDAEIERLLGGEEPSSPEPEEGLQLPEGLEAAQDYEGMREWAKQYVDDSLDRSQGTTDQNRAMKAYQGIWYEIMNGNLRDGSYADDPRNAPMIADAKTLSEAIANAPGISSPLLTYRGLYDDPGFALGQVFTEKGFLSTSLSAEATNGFTNARGGVIMRITAPAGTPAALGSLYEAEVIFAPGTQLEVTKIEDAGGMRYVTARIKR